MRKKAERGAALVEFALLALVLYVLVFGGIEMGRIIFASQVLQEAARIAARELSVTPLPAGKVFSEALLDTKSQIFDENLLVIDLEPYDPSPGDSVAQLKIKADNYQAALAGLPLLNRALLSLYISDRPQIAGARRHFLRYPGTLLKDTVGAFTVQIPQLANGVLSWHTVLEEVVPNRFEFGQPQGGVAAVKLNYPFQAGALVGYHPAPATPGDPLPPNVGNPIIADDSGFTPPPNYIFALDDSQPPESRTGAYSGKVGLGVLYNQNKEVRPYRNFITGQAVFRREVTQEILTPP